MSPPFFWIHCPESLHSNSILWGPPDAQEWQTPEEASWQERLAHGYDRQSRQQHGTCVAMHPHHPRNISFNTKMKITIDRVLMSASFLILFVMALTCSSLSPNLSWSDRDLTAFHPVSRDPIWT